MTAKQFNEKIQSVTLEAVRATKKGELTLLQIAGVLQAHSNAMQDIHNEILNEAKARTLAQGSDGFTIDNAVKFKGKQ